MKEGSPAGKKKEYKSPDEYDEDIKAEEMALAGFEHFRDNTLAQQAENEHIIKTIKDEELPNEEKALAYNIELRQMLAQDLGFLRASIEDIKKGVEELKIAREKERVRRATH